MAHLTVSGATRGSFALGPHTRIGRDPTSDVVIDHPSVSRHHAEIVRIDDGRFRIIDVDSSQGTFVGGARVHEALLYDGDEIQCGSVRLLFEDPAARMPAREDVRVAADHEPFVVAHRVPLAGVRTLPQAADLPDAARLARDYDKLRIALALTRAIGAERDPDRIARIVVETCFDLVGADRVAVLLFDPATGHATSKVARVRDPKTPEVVVPRSVLREALVRRAAVLCMDSSVDPRFRSSASVAVEQVRSAMCVAFEYRGQAIGALYADSRAREAAFDDSDLEVFCTAGEQGAMAIGAALESRQIERVREGHASYLRAVLEAMPLGVVLLANDGTVRLATPRAREMLQMDAAAQPSGGESLGASAARFVRDLIEVLHERVAEDVAVPSSPPRWLEVLRETLVHDGAQETLLVLRDVTELREQAQRESKQARLALVGQVAGGVAHDFNNLISVVGSYAELLERRVTDPVSREEARLIVQTAKRAAGVTRQLLALGQRSSYNAPQRVNVSAIVRDLERLLRRTLGERVELKTTFSAGAPAVLVDAAKMEQVVLNLVLNARDATPDGGRISLLVEPATDRGREGTRLEVADTGVGMPPEVVSRIFEPFFTTKPEGLGTGLGLTTVSRIVEQAGGRVEVESAPSHGTTFRVWLPAAPGTDAPLSEEDVAAPLGRGETVLVVENDGVVRELLRRLLDDAGYQVLTAAGGAEVTRRFSSHERVIDLLLTDQVMPNESGVELALRLSRERPSLKVLLVSGDPRVIDLGSVPHARFLPKPFVRDQLLHAVRAALDD
jgi:signal transduction histidine kinase